MGADLLQPPPLSWAQLHRDVLQHHQALPADRDSLRQVRSQLPGVRIAGINPPLATRLGWGSRRRLDLDGLAMSPLSLVVLESISDAEGCAQGATDTRTI